MVVVGKGGGGIITGTLRYLGLSKKKGWLAKENVRRE